MQSHKNKHEVRAEKRAAALRDNLRKRKAAATRPDKESKKSDDIRKDT